MVGKMLCLVPPALLWCLSLGRGCIAVQWCVSSAFLQLFTWLTQRPTSASKVTSSSLHSLGPSEPGGWREGEMESALAR